jgi:hypothetical protein
MKFEADGEGVILSEAKDPLTTGCIARLQGILRCAQDDTPFNIPVPSP